MERLEKILEIKVDVNDAIKGITDLNKEIDAQRQYQKRLQEQIKELSKDYAANAGEIEQLQQEMVKSKELTKDYSSQVQVLSRNVQNQLKVDRENIGSLKQLRAQLSNLTSAYDALSEEERNAAKGREMKDKINEVTDSLKGAEEATQRYYRNVGNYENAIKNTIGLNGKFGQTLQNVAEMTKNGVGPALTQMNTAVRNVGKETTKLLANPIVATLALIATAIMAVVKGIKSSEENTAKWSATMAKFKPFMDLVTVACQKFAGVILDIIGGIGKATGAVMKWLEKLPLVGDKIADINKESERYVQIAEESYQIDVDRRKLEEESANAALKVSELRTKAKDKERYSDEERLKFVQEANEVERKIAEEKVALAERALKAAEEEAKATQNQKEVEEKLSQLRIAVSNEQKAYFDKTRELLEQENTIKNEIAAKDKARADATEAENDKKLAKQKEYNDALEEATREAEDMFIELMEEGLEKEKEIERVRYERQKQAIEEKQAQYGKDTEIYQQYALQLERAAQLHNETLADLEKEYNKSYEEAIEERKVTDEQYLEHKKRMAELEKKIEDSKLREYSSIAGSISSILDATAGDNVKRVKAAKLAALAEIAINQGIAIAQAVTSVKGLVFPANLPAIAASVASALSALVPAIQSVNSVKLARGGRVSGAGTSTSDSIPAMLSNGEFVVNARATSMFPELLETINNLGLGLGAPARMEKVTTTRIERDNAEALVKALQQMPAPVVSVEEINRTGRRVEALERLSRLA
jgi:myosin heavy subunit